MAPHKNFRALLGLLLVGLTAFVLNRTLGRDRAPAAPPFSPSQTADGALARQQPRGTPQQTTPPGPRHPRAPQPSTATGDAGQQPWGSTVRADRLSVRVQNHSLQRLLEEIANQSEVPIIVSEGVEDQRVSLQFHDLPLDQGLRMLLHAFDAFFFYRAQGPEAAMLHAVWIYAPGQGRRVMPVPPEAWASTAELSAGLHDPDPSERARMVEVVIDRRGKQAMDTVMQALEDEEEKVRYRTLYKALNAGVVLPPDLLQHLVVADPSPVVRFLALEALAHVPGTAPESLREAAELALRDPDAAVQEQAWDILDALEVTSRPAEITEPPLGQEGAVSR